MSNGWIKARTDLFTHPKVVRISSALKADRFRTVGGLLSVWCLFDAHTEDGILDGYTPELIDDLIGWSGFANAMASVGWLEVSEDFVSMPDFDAHNGKSAKRRAQEAERKRLERIRNESGQASASDADKKRTREEKRREDIEEANASSIEGATKKRGAKRCPEYFALTDDLRDWAVEHAPDVDVDLATAKFKDHTFATARTDWLATWRNWLRSEQERAGKGRGKGKPAESFAERDERLARERYEAFIGRKSAKVIDGEIIDVTPAQLQIGGDE